MKSRATIHPTGGRGLEARFPQAGQTYEVLPKALLRRLSVAVASLALIAGVPETLLAQATDEAHVKAAFLFNFAKFVSWPSQVFKNPSDSFRICVLGPGVVGPALAELARDKMVGDRPLIVSTVSESTAATSCQILFVAATSTQKARLLLDELKSRSVLTVGESAGFAANGGMINFKVEDGRVRFEINPKAAEQARLQISSRLLSLAQIVTGSR
jgi:hypothetical protein